MIYEYANCKMSVSKCKEIDPSDVLHVERPLKIKTEIPSLNALVSELHTVFSSTYVNVDYVSQLMSSYKSNVRDWKRFAKFDRFRYTRNLVDAGNGLFNVMVLCWGPGHASAIHDHADSHCFMKMLRGELEEVRYKWPQREKQSTEILADRDANDNCHIGPGEVSDSCQCDSCQYNFDQMVETGRTRLEENDVCYINDTLGLHRVENPSHVEGSVSLHLYSPPFDSCRVFDARTGRASTAKVTFWSVGGKRNKIKEEH